MSVNGKHASSEDKRSSLNQSGMLEGVGSKRGEFSTLLSCNTRCPVDWRTFVWVLSHYVISLHWHLNFLLSLADDKNCKEMSIAYNIQLILWTASPYQIV